MITGIKPAFGISQKDFKKVVEGNRFDVLVAINKTKKEGVLYKGRLVVSDCGNGRLLANSVAVVSKDDLYGIQKSPPCYITGKGKNFGLMLTDMAKKLHKGDRLYTIRENGKRGGTIAEV